MDDATHGMHDNRLTADSRAEALAAMEAAPLDILVIGGGITGAGIALDAATRGLAVGVVEAQDWASGTSSRSSKLIHGGLRYLQMLDFGLVLEALRERDLLIRTIAPHLVRPLPFIYPLRYRVVERAFVGAGILLYDLLAGVRPGVRGGGRAVPFHRHLTRGRLAQRFGGLKGDAAVGGIEYWDATVDDARLVSTVVRTAVGHGARVASRTQVVELTKAEDGAVTGAVLVDLETGRRFTVRAGTVISSTGVWTERAQSLASDSGGLRVLASKGIHIVVPRDRIAGESGIILKTATSVLFIIPWSRYWVIGTTDTPWSEDLAHPVATATDIEYVLDQANRVLGSPLAASDVIGTWAGLRPLLQPGTKDGTQSARVSREHTVASPARGMVTIAGGKLTTYRVMARDAVDFALGSARRERASVTRAVPLVGAAGLDAARAALEGVADRFGWTTTLVDHLLHRYGSAVADLVALCEADPSLARRITGAEGYVRAEVVYAVTHEGALHLDDVMMRRTRMVYEYPDAADAALEEVADLVAAAAGWDAGRRAHEVSSYRDRAAAVRDAALETTDRDAARVRGRAVPSRRSGSRHGVEPAAPGMLPY